MPVPFAVSVVDTLRTSRAMPNAIARPATGQNPRLRATDPGNVENNPVFTYHDAFNPNVDEVIQLDEACAD